MINIENLTDNNMADKRCPLCAKKLRYKGPCCSDKNSYLVCPCGYKEVYKKAAS